MLKRQSCENNNDSNNNNNNSNDDDDDDSDNGDDNHNMNNSDNGNDNNNSDDDDDDDLIMLTIILQMFSTNHSTGHVNMFEFEHPPAHLIFILFIFFFFEDILNCSCELLEGAGWDWGPTTSFLKVLGFLLRLNYLYVLLL